MDISRSPKKKETARGIGEEKASASLKGKVRDYREEVGIWRQKRDTRPEFFKTRGETARIPAILRT